MVRYSGSGYAGLGHVGIIDACFQIAEAHHPDRWCAGAIPEKEEMVWNDVGSRLDPELLWKHLDILVPRPRDDAALFDRFLDFEAAVNILRVGLHADKFRALFYDDNGRATEIDPSIWGGEAGLMALRSGAAWIRDGDDDVRRFLLVPSDVVTRLHAEKQGPHKQPLHTSEGKPTRRGALPKYDWTSIHSLLKAEVELRGGLPQLNNPKGWRIDADGERLLMELCGQEPGEATVRREWQKFKAAYGAHKGS